MIKTAIKKFDETINNMNTEDKEIIKSFVSGKTMLKIAEELGRFKQSIHTTVKKRLKDFYQHEEIMVLCEKMFTETNLYYKDKYIDCSVVSDKYATLLALIAKDHYGFHVYAHIYAITEKGTSITFRKEMTGKQNNYGFPIPITTKDEYGRMDRNAFLATGTQDQWVFDRKKENVIGNPRLKFAPNLCKFQIHKITSLWDVYAWYIEEAPKYLVDMEIETPGKLSQYFQWRSIKDKDHKCVMHVVVPKKNSPYGFPIHELDSVEATEDELVMKIEKLPIIKAE